MNAYLSHTEIWVEPTPPVLDLRHKRLLIVRGKSKQVAELGVSIGNPHSPHAGKVTVFASPIPDGRVDWSQSVGSMTPRDRSMGDPKEYLNEDALSLIQASEDGSCYGCGLVLRIPEQRRMN